MIGIVIAISILVVVAATSCAIQAAPLEVEWQKTYGTSGIETATALIEETDGYLLAGSAPTGTWLVKTDLLGVQQWNKIVTASNAGGINDIIKVDDGYLMAGSASPTPTDLSFWLAKTDLSGNLIWSQTYGSSSSFERVNCMVDTGDGIILVGTYTSSLRVPYATDILVMKTDYSGTQIWNQTYGLRGITPYPLNEPKGLAKTSSGYAIVASTSIRAGTVEGVASDLWLLQTYPYSSTSLILNKTFPNSITVSPTSMVLANDGYVIAGYSVASDNNDFWLAKLDTSANMVWNYTYGTALDEVATCLVQTNDGYLIAGRAIGTTSDIWVLKTDLAGVQVWNKTIGDTAKDETAVAIVDASDGFAVAGTSDDDFFLVKLSEPSSPPTSPPTSPLTSPPTSPPTSSTPTPSPSAKPPSGSVKISNGASKTNSTIVVLNLSATDSSGITEMRFSNDNIIYSPWQEYSETATWMLSGGDGEKTVYVQLKDAEGNIATLFDSIILQTEITKVTPTSEPITTQFPTELLIIAAVIAVVIVIVALLLLNFLKRPKKPQAPAQIKVTAEPVNLVANGEEKSVITLQLLDKNGEPMSAPTDTTVKVTAAKGKLEPSIITIPKGKDAEKTILISSTEAGPVPVSADAEGLKSITITLNFTPRTRYCMHCGTQMSIKDKACRNCGKAPPAGADTKTCANCEAVIPVIAKFCSECGAGQQV